MRILVLSGSNHGFDKSAPVIAAFLSQQPDMQVTVDDDKTILTAPQLNEYDVCVFGTGFTRTSRQDDGTIKRESDLTPAQEAGLFNFIESGKGWSACMGPPGGSADGPLISSAAMPTGTRRG
ncbi:MAG: hypothetical protein R3E79_42010 [Caldilineaceae bacterium]